jgi:hypothetical protein
VIASEYDRFDVRLFSGMPSPLKRKSTCLRVVHTFVMRPIAGAIPYGQKIETAQRRQRSNIFGLGPVLHNKLAVDA